MASRTTAFAGLPQNPALTAKERKGFRSPIVCAAIAVVVFLVPFRTVLVQLSQKGLGTEFWGNYAKECLLTVILFWTTLRFLLYPQLRELVRRHLLVGGLLPFHLFYLYIVLRFLYGLTEEWRLAGLGLAVYAAYAVLFLLVILNGLSLSEVTTVTEVLVATVPLAGAAALFEVATGYEFGPFEPAFNPYSSSAMVIYRRISSLTGSSIHFGLYLAMLLPLPVSLLLDRGPRRSLAQVLSIMFGLFGLAVAYSRGAWVLFILAIAVLAALKRSGKLLVGAGAMLLGMIALVLALNYFAPQGMYLQRFGSILDWKRDLANVGRLETWSADIQIAQKGLLLGHGLATTGNAPLKFGLPSITNTENSYLKLLIEGGIPALALFLWMFWSFWIMGYRARQYLSGRARSVAEGILAALAGTAAEMWVYGTLETQIGSCILWLYFAYLFVAYVSTRQNLPRRLLIQ